MGNQAISLRCTACGAAYPAAGAHTRCAACGGALELPLIKNGGIARGEWAEQTVFGRYKAFYPYFPDIDVLTLGEGFTPLLEMPELADDAGVDVLYVKNEAANPTWSFKDRGTAAGIRRALQLGYGAVGTVSSGNMALSVAAFAARASLKAVILVSDTIAEEKLAPIAVYGPRLIRVRGDYAELYGESLRAAGELGVYFINSDEPFRVEGYKSLAYEVCEQLQFNPPDYLLVPTSSGGHFRGILKGMLEMRAAGLIPRVPRMVCVQPAGCAPIAAAFGAGEEAVARVACPDTIAHAICNPYPPSGDAVLRAMREHDGLCVSVTDEEMLRAQREMAQSGLFAQPESCAAYAAVKRLGQEGIFTGRERVVCVNTSSGLKTPSILKRHGLESGETDLVGLRAYIGEKLK